MPNFHDNGPITTHDHPYGPPPGEMPFRDEVPYYLRQDYRENFAGGKNGPADQPRSYHFQTKDDLGLSTAWLNVLTASIESTLLFIRYNLERAQSKKEFELYEKAYSKVLQNPDKWSLLNIDESEMSAETFAKILREKYHAKANELQSIGGMVVVDNRHINKVSEFINEYNEHPEEFKRWTGTKTAELEIEQPAADDGFEVIEDQEIEAPDIEEEIDAGDLEESHVIEGPFRRVPGGFESADGQTLRSYTPEGISYNSQTNEVEFSPSLILKLEKEVESPERRQKILEGLAAEFLEDPFYGPKTAGNDTQEYYLMSDGLMRSEDGRECVIGNADGTRSRYGYRIPAGLEVIETENERVQEQDKDLEEDLVREIGDGAGRPLQEEEGQPEEAKEKDEDQEEEQPPQSEEPEKEEKESKKKKSHKESYQENEHERTPEYSSTASSESTYEESPPPTEYETQAEIYQETPPVETYETEAQNSENGTTRASETANAEPSAGYSEPETAATTSAETEPSKPPEKTYKSGEDAESSYKEYDKPASASPPTENPPPEVPKANVAETASAAATTAAATAASAEAAAAGNVAAQAATESAKSSTDSGGSGGGSEKAYTSEESQSGSSHASAQGAASQGNTGYSNEVKADIEKAVRAANAGTPGGTSPSGSGGSGESGYRTTPSGGGGSGGQYASGGGQYTPEVPQYSPNAGQPKAAYRSGTAGAASAAGGAPAKINTGSGMPPDAFGGGGGVTNTTPRGQTSGKQEQPKAATKAAQAAVYKPGGGNYGANSGRVNFTSVGTYSANKSALSASQLAIGGSKTGSISMMNALNRSAEPMQVAAFSAFGIMAASAGARDPAMQQLKSVQKLIRAANVMRPHIAGQIGARSLERQMLRTAQGINKDAIEKYTKKKYDGLKKGESRTILSDKLRKRGIIHVNPNGSWDIDKKRLYKEVLGSRATKQQKKALDKQLRQEESMSQNKKVSIAQGAGARIKYIAGELRNRAGNYDDSTRGMVMAWTTATTIKNATKFGLRSAGSYVKNKYKKYNIKTRYQNRGKKYQNAQKKALEARRKNLQRQNLGKKPSRRLTRKEAKYQEKAARQSEWMKKHAPKYGAAKAREKRWNARRDRIKNAPRNLRNRAVDGAKNRINTVTAGARSGVKAAAGNVRNVVGRSRIGRGYSAFAASRGGRRVGRILRRGKHILGGAARGVGKVATFTKLAVGKVMFVANLITDPLAAIKAAIQRLWKKVMNWIFRTVFGFLFDILIKFVLVAALASSIFMLAMFIGEKVGDEVQEMMSTDSLASVMYSELRYMEIEWASAIRSYGTTKNPVSLNPAEYTQEAMDVYNNKNMVNIKYTNNDMTLEEYLNSDLGVKDLLGAYAQSAEQHALMVPDEYGAMSPNGPMIYDYGVQGPQPFEGAMLEDYKLITAVDGGNTLELEGRPMEGWTSNAKEITAMTIVFYGQVIDEMTEGLSSSDPLDKFIAGFKLAWHSLGSWLEAHDVLILGTLAGGTSWSFAGIMRQYAYPLALESKYENYYLSTYIFPTKWSEPNLQDNYQEDYNEDFVDNSNSDSASYENKSNDNARYDTSQELKTANKGDIVLNEQYGYTLESAHKDLGKTKSGGSGKVDTKNHVSKNAYGVYGDDDYAGFELCSSGEGTYNGYGCMLRYKFNQKWKQAWGTDKEGNLENEEGSGITTLYYGDENGEKGIDPNNNNVEFDHTGVDVSDDVSPYYEDDDVSKGYNKHSCLIHPLKMSNKGWSCWEVDTDVEGEVGSPQEKLEENGYNFDAEYAKKTFHSIADDVKLDRFEITDEGFDVWMYNEVEVEHEDHTEIETTMFCVHVKHACTGQHMGVYCGGHAQLRTRGVVLGLSRDQLEDNTTNLKDNSQTSLYDPKNLDPDSPDEASVYSDAVDVYGNDIKEFHASDYAGVTEEGITDDDAKYIKLVYSEDTGKRVGARDLYDVDALIKHKESFYPSENSESGGWKGWTLSNMGQVSSIISNDWEDQYNVVDTQTIVGGQQNVNTVDTDTMNNVLNQLGWDKVANGMHIQDPVAVEKHGQTTTYPIVTDSGTTINNVTEEVEYINQLRHLRYAIEMVGKVGYNQDQHDPLWGNLEGHQTDCSGFVSNIWRDALGLTGFTHSALSTSELKAEAGSAYHSSIDDDIEPGDIILKNPDGGDSAHALIYVGKIDIDAAYADDKNAEGGTITKTVDPSKQKIYTIDCSSMVITSDTYQDNAPNKLAEQKWAGGSFADMVGALLGNDNNKEPDGGAFKVRSGNVRFAARDYMNGSFSGELGYIDMSEMAKNNGQYSIDGSGALVCRSGNLETDFQHITKMDGDEVVTGEKNKDYVSRDQDIYWNNLLRKGGKEGIAQKPGIRNTVIIGDNQGTEASNKKAEKLKGEVYEAPKDGNSNDNDWAAWEEYISTLPDDSNIYEEFQKFLETHPDWKGYYNKEKYFKSFTVNGKTYYMECQTSGAYSTAYGTGGSSIASVGCFMYALQTGIMAKTGHFYSMSMLVASDGGRLVYNPNTGEARQTGSMSNVGGSYSKTANAFDSANSMFGTNLSANYHSSTSLSDVNKALAKGNPVLVYSSGATDPGKLLHHTSNKHWTVIVGTTDDSYIVMNNGSAGLTLIPKNQMPKSFESSVEVGESRSY